MVARREDAACGRSAGSGRESFRGRPAQRHFGEPSFHLASTITGGQAPALPRFAAVQIAGPVPVAEPARPPSKELPQPRPATSSRGGLIEISLGGGKWVRVDASFDAAALARVLDVLERR
jgi:hypothetical protein